MVNSIIDNKYHVIINKAPQGGYFWAVSMINKPHYSHICYSKSQLLDSTVKLVKETIKRLEL